MNRVTIIGNLGRDPETRSFSNGGSVTNFSVAVTEKWKDRSGETQERTEWIRCACFVEKLGEFIANNARKGTQVFVEGKLETRKWQDKDGKDQYSTEVVLRPFSSTFKILKGWANEDEDRGGRSERRSGSHSWDSGRRESASTGSGGGRPHSSQKAPPLDDDSDIPF